MADRGGVSDIEIGAAGHGIADKIVFTFFGPLCGFFFALLPGLSCDLIQVFKSFDSKIVFTITVENAKQLKAKPYRQALSAKRGKIGILYKVKSTVLRKRTLFLKRDGNDKGAAFRRFFRGSNRLRSAACSRHCDNK